jgi:hypothetical protein
MKGAKTDSKYIQEKYKQEYFLILLIKFVNLKKINNTSSINK